MQDKKTPDEQDPLFHVEQMRAQVKYVICKSDGELQVVTRDDLLIDRTAIAFPEPEKQFAPWSSDAFTVTAYARACDGYPWIPVGVAVEGAMFPKYERVGELIAQVEERNRKGIDGD